MFLLRTEFMVSKIAKYPEMFTQPLASLPVIVMFFFWNASEVSTAPMSKGGSFRMESACSLYACVGSLWVVVLSQFQNMWMWGVCLCTAVCSVCLYVAVWQNSDLSRLCFMQHLTEWTLLFAFTPFMFIRFYDDQWSETFNYGRTIYVTFNCDIVHPFKYK